MSTKKKILLIVAVVLIALQCLYVYIFYWQQGYGYFEYLYNSAKHNYDYRNNIIDLQYIKNEDLYLYIDEEEIRICDYESDDILRRVNSLADSIRSFVTNDSYFFYLNSESCIYQYDINHNRIAEMQMPDDDNIKLAYAENDSLYTINRDSISVLDISTGKVIKTIEGFTKYEKNEMGFVRSVKDDNYLLILGSNYDGNTYHVNYYINTSGTVGDFNKSVICFVDLESGKVVKEYVISSGEVVYMDEEKYATVKEGVISFYNFDDKHKIREVTIKGYEMPNGENGRYSYDFVCYDGKIIVSHWEGVIDEIPVE